MPKAVLTDERERMSPKPLRHHMFCSVCFVEIHEDALTAHYGWHQHEAERVAKAIAAQMRGGLPIPGSDVVRHG